MEYADFQLSSQQNVFQLPRNGMRLHSIGYCRVIAAAIVVGAFARPVLASGEEKAQPPVTIEAIVAKWKECSEYFKSFEFLCNGEHFEIASAVALRESPDEKVPDDISHRRRRFVLSADDRSRSEEDGSEWDGNKKTYVPKRTVDVFDGKARSTFFEDRFAEPHAYFQIRGGNIFGKDARNLPLRMALCPLRQGIGEFGAVNLVLTDETATIDDHALLVLKADSKKLWIDPEKDFLPVKREDEHREFIDKKIEISYQRDKTHGWVPSSWTTTLLSQTGKITWQDTMTVTEFSINKPVDDSEFKLSLPAGTVIRDYGTGEQRVAQPNAEKPSPVQNAEGAKAK
jgi:hypothetical protein